MSSSSNASKSSNKGLLVLLTLLAIAGVGFGGYTWWTTQQIAKSANEEDTPSNISQPIFMDLEPFTVNLPGLNEAPDRVLYINITLRLGNEKSRKQLHDYLPEVRSRLLLLLSEQKSKVLNSHEGKLQLMQSIKDTLSPTMIPGEKDQQITDVLFTTFILR
ncbi:flagellar basal body-associated protein FliL [Providencia vermicola]|uniref:flagellar basal body-associated protein FliL n=1 Tax=Providencia TaxID=586 RepID=UPI0012B666FF|nr:MULTISPECIES: flagellar basal body-associated protein FliL [unclassified Providencia]MTB39966.1 flagellar basal body-associated protein FliL [Providencia sp. wls1949]MTC08688.1 flagellar basal body-associated protein FliL [Providencia sp. wls1948]